MPPKAKASETSTAVALPAASSRSRHAPSSRSPRRVSTNASAAPRTSALAQHVTHSSALASDIRGCPHYGEVVESDAVHDEIRALGTEVKSMIAQYAPRHGTSESQVVWGVRQFGPSKESRRALNKENEAAKLACEKRVYCLWRCTEKPKLQGANMDFCCRLGYRHVCFCGHPMAAHTTPARAANSSARSSAPSAASDRQLAQWKAPCETAGCGCTHYRYVPNAPLEIGEAWLTKRANWKASEWSAKCRCGHGHKRHNPSSSSGLRCRDCGGCGGFTSAFLCVVCDLPWEAHETVWESEGVRVQAGLPVREAYAPLADVDWDVREAVLADATLGGRLEPSATYVALQGQQRQQHGQGRTALLHRSSQGGSAQVEEVTEAPEVAVTPQRPSQADAVLDAEYCPACATIFRSVASKFCTKCGQPRPRRPVTLR